MTCASISIREHTARSVRVIDRPSRSATRDGSSRSRVTRYSVSSIVTAESPFRKSTQDLHCARSRHELKGPVPGRHVHVVVYKASHACACAGTSHVRGSLDTCTYSVTLNKNACMNRNTHAG